MQSWSDRKPRLLERIYRISHGFIKWLDPAIARFGYKRIERILRPPERWSKRALFDCQMCGQCILRSTGMVCSMSCPKNLRNGACGGVRANGHCEVIPEMKCVWVTAYEQARTLNVFGHEMLTIKPPLNNELRGSSAWINLLTGVDQIVPKGWVGLPSIAALEHKRTTGKL